MLPKERVAKLLDNGLSRKPLMLHGTSLESLLVLFNTGTLPPGRDTRSATKSYLYFSNVQKNFAGKKYSGLRGVDNSEALEVAKSYAQINAEQRYINGALISEGIDSKWAYKAVLNFLIGGEYWLPKGERKKVKSLGGIKFMLKPKSAKASYLRQTNAFLSES
ncbi:MAG: hypothetical protein NTY99_03980 [DPANN group archaeon]|nr:hypothetical protein [DPANN group archaeon]